ncbi:MAG: M1 family peptidase, partial [Polaribacter sp.]
SGVQLQWYLTDWTQTTNTIDYALNVEKGEENKTILQLERKGLMPMPLEILVQYKNGDAQLHYIPISLMRGEKENPYPIEWNVHADWTWANPKYSIELNRTLNDIEAVVIDPSNLMADIDKTNNYYVSPEK